MVVAAVALRARAMDDDAERAMVAAARDVAARDVTAVAFVRAAAVVGVDALRADVPRLVVVMVDAALRAVVVGVVALRVVVPRPDVAPVDRVTVAFDMPPRAVVNAAARTVVLSDVRDTAWACNTPTRHPKRISEIFFIPVI